jgi:hypothetical protein
MIGGNRFALAVCIAWLSSYQSSAVTARLPVDVSSLGVAGSAADSHAILRRPVPRKRGVGWGLNATLIHTLAGMNWWYNWGPSVGDPAAMEAAEAEGMRFVPMQWGRWGIDQLAQHIQPGSKIVLGYNEPNHQLQANMTPQEAAVRAAASRSGWPSNTKLLCSRPGSRCVSQKPHAQSMQALWPQLQAVADKLELLLGSPAAAPCGASCVTPNPFACEHSSGPAVHLPAPHPAPLETCCTTASTPSSNATLWRSLIDAWKRCRTPLRAVQGGTRSSPPAHVAELTSWPPTSTRAACPPWPHISARPGKHRCCNRTARLCHSNSRGEWHKRRCCALLSVQEAPLPATAATQEVRAPHLAD